MNEIQSWSVELLGGNRKTLLLIRRFVSTLPSYLPRIQDGRCTMCDWEPRHLVTYRMDSTDCEAQVMLFEGQPCRRCWFNIISPIATSLLHSMAQSIIRSARNRA